MISKIEIKNVKGYGIPGKALNVNLDPEKVNLCVAPNGFGKSSLATAFESLKRTKLDVSEDNKHIGHKAASCSLKLTIDGYEYTADDTKNDLSDYIPCVIHNRSRVDYSKRRVRGYVNVEAYIEIEDIEVGSVEPPVRIPYSINTMKNVFGVNKKIVTSIDYLLADNRFLCLLQECFNDFVKFQTKTRKNKVKAIQDQINKLRGTEEQLRTYITDDYFAVLEAEESYANFKNKMQLVMPGTSGFEIFNLFFQLLYLWNNQKDKIRGACKRAQYERYKQRVDDNLRLLDTTGRTICSKEYKGKLVVTFPHANEISNGQRDVLTFATELMVFKAAIRADKKYILIIDEVFDYLDDANTMAAQYYLSKIVNNNNGNIYIVLLTHLNPYYFRNYIFNDKIINQVYLEETLPVATQEMMKFISFRQKLDTKNNANDKALEEDLSCYIFHYNPQVKDLSAAIAAYAKPGVKSTWGKPDVFKLVLLSELNKYFAGNSVYDPYAVALALRLGVEKVMYDQLDSAQLKQEFVETHKTNNKLEFCEKNNLPVPDAYFIVNAIHNSSDHLRENPVTGKFEEKAMVYKLQNKVIRNILEKLFGYNGQPLDVAVIS
jgi:energy-coupling factor transporter ATP-binding protein EcfA2